MHPPPRLRIVSEARLIQILQAGKHGLDLGQIRSMLSCPLDPRLELAIAAKDGPVREWWSWAPATCWELAGVRPPQSLVKQRERYLERKANQLRARREQYHTRKAHA